MKQFREKLFSLRSYTPIPFLLVMILFAKPTIMTLMIGLTLVVMGEFMRFWGVAYAGSLTRVTGSVGAPEVIVAGPFGYVRNPLYVGNMLTYIGIGIMSNAIFPWLVLLAGIWFAFQYYQIVALEEEFLEKKFETSYRTYKQSVPRFIPQLSRYISSDPSEQVPHWSEAVRSERRTFQALGIVITVIVVLWYMRY